MRAAQWPIAFATLFAVGACDDFAGLSPRSTTGGPGGTTPCTTPVSLTAGGKIDVLFMVDNSNSMDAMSLELRTRFAQFLTPFKNLAAKSTFVNLHLGVVTSDYGAGKTGSPGCMPSPGGQQGKLQALGVKAPNTCKAPKSANYIAYDFAGDNNLPMGQDLETTFACMAAVGVDGCGIEHQLESVYAALTTNPSENFGFLRDDALLMVVFVTNEDDGSAPADTDLFDKNLTQMYGYMDSYSRQTRWAIECGTPPSQPPYGSSNGPLSDCVPAPNPNGMGPGKQFDVQRYIDLFTKPQSAGGIKAKPTDVLLAAIDAPEAPFQVLLSDPGTAGGVAFRECPKLNEGSNPPCVPVLQHSCVNLSKPAFFGDPAVRLNTVVRAAANHSISSICDSDYSTALSAVANRAAGLLGGGGCLAQPLLDDAHPDCTIQDLIPSTNATVDIPACGARMMLPCWTVANKPECGGGLGVTVMRDGQPAAGTRTSGTCVAAASACK